MKGQSSLFLDITNILYWYFFIVVLFVCLGFSPTQQFFTHMDTSAVKGCKFRRMLGTHGHWADRYGSFAFHTYSDTGNPFKWSSPRIRDTQTYCWAFDSAVFGLSLMGFEHSAFLLRKECSCRLRLRVSVFVHSGLSGMNTSKCIRFVT